MCGEFKRGKSSLLNALLEEDPPLFPVDAAVATSLVTVASYAAEERITVGLAGPDGSATDRRIDRSEIATYVTEDGDPGNEQVATMLAIETPNPRLAPGFVVVDTPGVGGVFSDHTAATTAFLPSADAIVFVSDFTQPLTKSELIFLRRAAEAARLAGDADGFVFVITKADAIAAQERELVLANTVAKLVEVTGQPAEDLIVVAVSSRAKRAALATGDPKRLASSNFPALEGALWPAVSRRRARLILSAALSDLDAGIRALLDPLDAEAAALAATTAAEVEQLTEKAQRRRDKLQALRSGRAEWKQSLRRKVTQAGRTLRYDLDTRIDEVWDRVHGEYLNDPAYLDNPEELAGPLTTDVTLLAGSITQLAAQHAAQIQRDFAREHGLDFHLPEIAALPAPLVPPLEMRGSLQTPEEGDPDWDRMRSGVTGGHVGGKVGGVSGAAVGTALGSIFGGLGGSAAGARKEIEVAAQRRQRSELAARRRSIEAALKPVRRSQTRELQRALEVLMDGLGDAMLAELDSRILEQCESAADAAARLDGRATTTRREADELLAGLNDERSPLRHAQTAVRQLAAAAEQLGCRQPVAAPEGANDGEPATSTVPAAASGRPDARAPGRR